jgi:chitosanase
MSRQMILNILIMTVGLTVAQVKAAPSAGNCSGTDNETVSFTAQQRLIADEFISIFENGTKDIQYNSAENIGDNRGITAGRAGFTSATGDMRQLILQYTKVNPDNLLHQYVGELKRLAEIRYTSSRSAANNKASANVSNLPRLVVNWKKMAKRQDFRDAQDAYVDKYYFNEALKKANSIGVTYPLTLLSLYDANIMHGESGLVELVDEATRMTGNKTPQEGADETDWLINFNINRKQVMEADDTWSDALARIDELEDLIETENFQLEPFAMSIQRYDGEDHVLP